VDKLRRAALSLSRNTYEQGSENTAQEASPAALGRANTDGSYSRVS